MKLAAGTISQALRAAEESLSPVTETPRLDAEILLAHAMGMNRSRLLARLRDPFDAPGFEALLQRRLDSEPIAYILGEWEFFSMDFATRAPVLVPRPETEHLVESALEYLADHPAANEMLDLCTGTGCVAISIAKNASRVHAIAVDIASYAVELARENVARHQLSTRVEVRQGDLFAPLAGPPIPSFDVICANPPYVADAEWDSLPLCIRRHEDPGALLSGPDGLDLVRRIADEGRAWLREGGLLAMEIADGQSGTVCALMAALGYQVLPPVNDLAGIPRIVRGLMCAGSPRQGNLV
jgi:release factor glutamine methyltransferase